MSKDEHESLVSRATGMLDDWWRPWIVGKPILGIVAQTLVPKMAIFTSSQHGFFIVHDNDCRWFEDTYEIYVCLVKRQANPELFEVCRRNGWRVTKV